ncbi:MAG: PilZ domain-containing protein [Gammaproteobacteria bacterium]|nr:PilZ domain-containing protein [Gammaproteobacteria bacterium]
MTASRRTTGRDGAQERRRSARYPLGIDALLYHNGVPVVRGRTRDIGLEGAYVETGASMHDPGAELELELALRSETGIERHRTVARVRHVSRAGLGVAFEGFDTSLHRRLRRILRGAGEAGPP